MAKRSKGNRQTRIPGASLKKDSAADQPANTHVAELSGPRESLSARWRNAYMFVPVALAFLTAINTLWNGFASDDQQQVLNSPFIKDLSNLPEAFTTSVWTFGATDIKYAVDSFYRPIFNVLFTINYALFGTAPWGWHLMNVLIHCAVALLVFVVMNEFTGRKWVALIAAVLFAVHPAHAESVAWVSGITDPLVALFLLPAFYYYLLYRKSERKSLLTIALVFYFLALLSKETAIALPLIVAYCETAHFQDSAKLTRRFARAVAISSLFALPALIYFLLRYNALSSILFGGEPLYPLSYVFQTIPLALVKYLKLMAIPTGYSYQHYTELVSSVASVKLIAPLALIAAITAAVILSRSRLLKFSAVWFIVWLAPALAVLRQYEQEYLVQDRYLYLPSIGFCLAVAIGIERLAAQNLFGSYGRKAVIAVVAILTIILGGVLIKQNSVWRNNVTLYQNCVAVEPDSPPARSSLSLAYFEIGRPQEAEELVRAAIELSPQYLGAYLNLSYQAHRSGRTVEATEHLERAISTVPDGPITHNRLATAHLNLGMLYAQLKQFAKAESNIRRSIEMWPRPAVWFHAGEFYFAQGRYEEAAAMFEQTRQHISGSFAPIYLSLANTYERLNQKEKARAAYEQYLAVASPSASDYSNVLRRLSQL